MSHSAAIIPTQKISDLYPQLFCGLSKKESNKLKFVIKTTQEYVARLNAALEASQNNPQASTQQFFEEAPKEVIDDFEDIIPNMVQGFVVSSLVLNQLAKPALLQSINDYVLESNLDARLLAVYLSLGLFIEQLAPKSCVDFYAQGLVRVISQWQVTLTADQQKALNKELKKAEQSKISMLLQLMRMVRPGVPDEELFLLMPSGITSQEIKTSAASVSLVEAAKKINIALEQPQEIFEVMFQYYRLCEVFLERDSHTDLSKIDEGSLNTLIVSGEFEQALQSIGINVNSPLAEHVTCIAGDRVKSPQVDTSALYYLAHYYREAYKVIVKNDQGQWVIHPDQLMLQIEESKANVNRGEQKGFVQVMLNTTLSALCYPGVLAQIRQGFAGNSAAEEHFFKRLHDFYLINPPRFEQIFNYTLFDSKTNTRHVDDETAKWWFDKSNFYGIVVAHPAILQVVLECNDSLVLNWMTQAAHEQQDMRWAKLVLALKKQSDASDAAVSGGALSILQQEGFQFPGGFVTADLTGSIASIKVAQQLQRFFEDMSPIPPQPGKKASRPSIVGDSNPYGFKINSVQKAKAFLGLLSSSRYKAVLEELLSQASSGELQNAHFKVSALFGAVETAIAITKTPAREVFAYKQLSQIALVDLFLSYEEKNNNLRASEMGSVSSDSEVEKGRKVMKHDLLGYVLDKLDQLFTPVEGEPAMTLFDCFIESYAKPYAATRTGGKQFAPDVFATPESVKEVFTDSHKNKEKRETPFLYWLKEVFAGHMTRKLLERMSLLPDQALSQLVLMHGSADLRELANNKQTRDYVTCLVELIEDLGKKSGQTREALYENKVFARLAVLGRWVHYHEDLGTKDHGREFIKKGFAEFLVLNFDEISSGQLSPNTSLRHCFVYGYVADYIKRDGVQTSYTAEQLFEDDNKLKEVFKHSKSSDSLKKTDPFKWWLKEVFAGKLSAQMLSLINALPHQFSNTLLRPYEADLPKPVLDIINTADSALKPASVQDSYQDDEDSVSSRGRSGSMLSSPVSFAGQNNSQTGGQDKSKTAGLKGIFGFGGSK